MALNCHTYFSILLLFLVFSIFMFGFRLIIIISCSMWRVELNKLKNLQFNNNCLTSMSLISNPFIVHHTIIVCVSWHVMFFHEIQCQYFPPTSLFRMLCFFFFISLLFIVSPFSFPISFPFILSFCSLFWAFFPFPFFLCLLLYLFTLIVYYLKLSCPLGLW